MKPAPRCDNRQRPDGPVVRWARQEATRRGLALRVVRDGLADGLNDAQLVVAGARDQDGVMFPACPVVLVPEAPAAERSPRAGAEIVLGVDAREPAQAAVGFAFDMARMRGVRLRAVHSWRFPSCAAELPFGVPEEDRATWEDHEVQLLADALRPWREKHSDVHVLEGLPAVASGSGAEPELRERRAGGRGPEFGARAGADPAGTPGRGAVPRRLGAHVDRTRQAVMVSGTRAP
ncbi:universal stress protein [Streptomyces canus]|uniref:universal stress protein n=1 Tax=Streptomyces canus TaxID=58343 RepID=UPI0036A8A76F